MRDQPHRRYNALTGEWVTVSPHRMQRPWQGRNEPTSPGTPLHYDPDCHLCPGNRRAGGERNPEYTSTFAFTNDFAAFLPVVEPSHEVSHDLLRAQSVRGTCRVLCYSPRHDLTLAQMTADQIRSVIDLWASETQELGESWRWVQVFENKGEIMGCSNAHPHGQVWASDSLPGEPATELLHQKECLRQTGSVLLMEYLGLEEEQRERVVLSSDSWVALVPWWAVWPFEILLLPRRPVLRLPDLSVMERDDLAGVLRKLLGAYDALFETSFPYSMGWHGAPHDGDDYRCWQLHAHIYPPLLRSATIRKFMVGYEMLAEPQRDLTPEAAAARLRQSCG